MFSFKELFKIIAAISLLLPIYCGSRVFKTLSKNKKWYLYFLIFCFLTDVSIWILKNSERKICIFVFNIYSLIESIFLFWFIIEISKNKILYKFRMR
jgi:hypothetical protein